MMLFEFKYILSGAFVGFMTALTGIGGGSLMAPVLILLLGFQPATAVGTDLLFSSLTKMLVITSYSTKKYVNWPIVLWLALGSIPAVGLTIGALTWLHVNGHFHHYFVNKAIGIAIILSTLFYLGSEFFKRNIIWQQPSVCTEALSRQKKGITLTLGIVIGVMVALTSVGGGTLGTVALMVCYPYLKPVNLVATELTHAIPISLLAGIAYIFFGTIDFKLLLNLMVGSLPAAYVASRLADKVPQRLLKFLLSFLLLGTALRMLI